MLYLSGMNDMKLYELKMPVKLRVWTMDDGVVHEATCHHLDGMYSYCTLDDKKTNNVFHLSTHTPMVLVDGRYEIGEDK